MASLTASWPGLTVQAISTHMHGGESGVKRNAGQSEIVARKISV